MRSDHKLDMTALDGAGAWLTNMAFAVCEFHITSRLLFWALGGGATNSPSHVLYMGISYIAASVLMGH